MHLIDSYKGLFLIVLVSVWYSYYSNQYLHICVSTHMICIHSIISSTYVIIDYPYIPINGTDTPGGGVGIPLVKVGILPPELL